MMFVRRWMIIVVPILLQQLYLRLIILGKEWLK